jgi:hypothetical protein
MVSLVLVSLAGWGCTTYHDDPVALHSFRVSLSEDQPLGTGSPDAPLPFIAGISCVTQPCPQGEECIRYCAVSGIGCQQDLDCSTGDLCASACARAVYLDIEPIGTHGDPIVLTEDRWIHIRSVPGMILPPHAHALLKQGRGSQVKTYLTRAVGKTHLWVEDLGLGKSEEPYGQCSNGLDDDGDGWIDMADPDCEGPDDPREAPATYATGLSPELFFDSARIRHVQFTDLIAASPLDGQNLSINQGSLVVTNVTGSGFFLTDLDHQAPVIDGLPGYYNSFFVYTFNKPEGVRYGDTLCSFSGGVVEYQGNTQMAFPTYQVFRPGTPCAHRKDTPVLLDVPEPLDLTDLLEPEDPGTSRHRDQLMANASRLEPFESSLVTFKDVTVSSRFLACDSDENDQYPSSSDDDRCRDLCQEDPLCTQLESFFKYAQLAAFVRLPSLDTPETDAGKKIYVGLDMLKENLPLSIPRIGARDTSGNCPDLLDNDGNVLVENPHQVLIGDTLFWEYTCPAMDLNRVTGSLRHIYLCAVGPGRVENCGLQMHMVVPRFDSDFDFIAPPKEKN